MLDRAYPILPKQLPDGSTVWEEAGKARDIVAALRAYDRRYSLVRNFEDCAWEVWRLNENGEASRSFVADGYWLPDWSIIHAHLAEHDTWRGFDPWAAVFAADREREARIDAQISEMAGASADRMHYELVDEFSAHMPAARPMSFGPRGRRVRVSR